LIDAWEVTPASPPLAAETRAMKTGNLRWRIILTCFLATTINYIDRQCLSVSAPAISKQFGFSNADYSSIIMSFLIAYTIMQAVSGRIIDKIGARLGMTLSVLVWSIAGMLHSLANGLWAFRIFRFLLGAGEAGNWPAATKVVSEWFPARERGLAVAIFDSGSSLGGILAPPLVIAITLHYGWRMAFVAAGLLDFLWLGLWLRVYRRPEEHPRISSRELEMITTSRRAEQENPGPRVRWISLLRISAVWGVILGRALTDCCWWFYVYWLPKYLSDARGFSLAEIGMFAWIPFVAVDFGNLSGGWLSGHFLRRGWTLNAARKTVMAIGVVGMVAGLPAGFTSSARLCLFLVAVATLSYSAWATMMLTLPTDLFESSAVASVSGLSGMGAGLGGIVFTWIIGRVADKFSYRPIFVAAGLLPLLAIVLVQVLIPNIRRLELGTSVSCAPQKVSSE
jgi:ACS family hexuronate transporter-like MFS transporter